MIVRIIKKLESVGIKVHLPYTAKGTCKEPYVVVLDQGQMGIYNDYTGNKLIEILIYAPKNKYALIDELKGQVKKALSEETYMKRTGYEQPIIYLDDIEGFMSSIQYKISKVL